uniref:Uncharacterized protein n=1 Tax=Pseudictyota dubia TaxID=2749911 RepID=A0A7R9Z9J4_9STRA|mmetsp:Transcript_31127/g.57517  ORF Transcript_31127/g.57517 Transcript_31127/m.57517 type:complete len:283 (+) Transcript_31127:187-1035(+)
MNGSSLRQAKEQKHSAHPSAYPSVYNSRYVSNQRRIGTISERSFFHENDFPPPAAEADRKRDTPIMLPPPSPISSAVAEQPHIVSTPSVPKGKRGDPRMHRAVALRMGNPQMTLLDALVQGGFVFPGVGQPGASDRNIRDSDGVLLYQRKNQLNRRLRQERRKQEERPSKEDVKHDEEEAVPSTAAIASVKMQAKERTYEEKHSTDRHNNNYHEQLADINKFPGEFCPPARVLSSLKKRSHSDNRSNGGGVKRSFHESFLSLPDDIEDEMLGNNYIGESRNS